MTHSYSNKEREKVRVKFAKQRRKNKSIARCCVVAGISTSTFYSWNKDDDWNKKQGFSKDDGFSK